MNIKTKQIIDELELILGKFISDVTTDDLNTVTELNIRNFDVDGSVLDFNVDDLNLFPYLNKLSFTDMIIGNNILNYIFNSNITELRFNRCELFCNIDKPFEKIESLTIEYTDNFDEDSLLYFPNLKSLTFNGYKITKELPHNIKVLNILDTEVSDLNIIKNANLDQLYISKKEYNNNIDFYKNNLNVFVYDDNNIYLVNDGDHNE